MQVQIRPWGNSQGILLPKAIIQSAGFACNDILEADVCEGSLHLHNPVRHKTLEERIAESGVPLTLIGELDYGEPAGGEIW